MTKSILDITGDIRNELVLPVPDKVKRRLQEQNKSLSPAEQISVPDAITLHLVEAPIEDRRRFGEREAILKAQDKPEDYMIELIMVRAAAGTDERVVREMVNVAAPSAVTKITYACMYGELPKPTAGKPAT